LAETIVYLNRVGLLAKLTQSILFIVSDVQSAYSERECKCREGCAIQ
jgi:hypothetical protein